MTSRGMTEVTEQYHDFMGLKGVGEREASGILRTELLETHPGREAPWQLEIRISG